MSKRGFSLAELLISMVASVLMLSALVSMFYFSSTRAANALANASTVSQVQSFTDELNHYIGNALSSSTQVNASIGRNALKLVMPSNGTDPDLDGMTDTFGPVTVSRRGMERYGAGRRIWFYMSDSTGDYNKNGRYLWRAERNDDTTPSTTDKKRGWGFFYDANIHRYYLIDAITWTADGESAGFTVTATALVNNDKKTTQGQTYSVGQVRTLNLTRSALCRNWRR